MNKETTEMLKLDDLIFDYKIKKNKIIVEMFNGTKLKYDYTEEKEAEITRLMWLQYNKYLELSDICQKMQEEQIENKIKDYRLSSKILTFTGIGAIGFVLIGMPLVFIATSIFIAAKNVDLINKTNLNIQKLKKISDIKLMSIKNENHQAINELKGLNKSKEQISNKVEIENLRKFRDEIISSKKAESKDKTLTKKSK